MNYESLIGNDNVKEILKSTIRSQTILHSYLFVGKEGIGKSLFAKDFAQAILCQNKGEKACGTCKSCLTIQQVDHPDFTILAPEESSIKIGSIRKIQEKIIEKPILSQRKVYLIEDADKMTTEAQNCLLKTLEEPPEYMTIILISANEVNLLPTIQSRCTKIVFEEIANEKLKEFIEEKYTFPQNEETILIGAQGSIGRAIQIADKIEIYAKIEELVQGLKRFGLIELLNEKGEVLYKEKENIISILEYMSLYFYRLAKKNIQQAQQFVNCIMHIETTQKAILANSNYDMQIDYLLLKCWEEINEKNNRS